MAADQAPTANGTFTVHWGRLALAGVGLIALIALPVTFIVSLVTPLSGVVPFLALLVLVACVLGLRVSALARQRRRVMEQADARARTSVMLAEAAARADAQGAAGQATDGQAPSARDHEQGGRDASVMESVHSDEQRSGAESAAETVNAEARDLDVARRAAGPFDLAAHEAQARQQAREAAQQGTAPSAGVEARSAEPAAAEGQGASEDAASGKQRGLNPRHAPWAPREIPAPTYLSAAEAERPAPEAHVSPEEPKAQHVSSIRQAEQDRERAQQRRQRLDLDAVLQRRRA